MKYFMSGIVACALVSASGKANAELAYGIIGEAAGTELVSFDTANASATTLRGLLSGVLSGHAVRAIDVRPSTGELYAMSTGSNGAFAFYTVNVNTGALTLVGNGTTNSPTWTIRVSIDFDPVTDTIRAITQGVNNNFRFNPNTGALIQQDTSVAYGAGDVNAGSNPPFLSDFAYTNSFAGASSTTCFALDFNLDVLSTIGGPNGSPSANTGELFTIGENDPGDFYTSTAGTGFDISGTTGIAYMSHDDPISGTENLLSVVNLTTGRATIVGTFFVNILDIALAITPGVTCDSVDFNGNGIFPEDADIIDFFDVLAGAACPTGTCNDVDFNNNQIFPEDADIIDFLNTLAGAQCP
jgi:trimeric autotransporter adhesin